MTDEERYALTVEFGLMAQRFVARGREIMDPVAFCIMLRGVAHGVELLARARDEWNDEVYQAKIAGGHETADRSVARLLRKEAQG